MLQFRDVTFIVYKVEGNGVDVKEEGGGGGWDQILTVNNSIFRQPLNWHACIENSDPI